MRMRWLAKARPKQLAPTDEDWSTWMALAGRGFGKGYSLETPIPTPTGWTTMGALRVGDQVFDEAGKPCRVTATFEIPQPERPHAFTFSDGSIHRVCGEHQWVTWTHRERKAYLRHGPQHIGMPDNWPAWRTASGIGPQIRTTDEIVATLKYGSRGDINHCIPVCGALDMPHAELPLDPWCLGYWLGNGESRGGSISSHYEDVQEVRTLFAAQGFASDAPKNGKDWYARGLKVVLRSMGLLHNKRVPAAYLRASIEQRLALLRGLMDSDGHCSVHSGYAEFCSMRECLADAVFELAVSLGQKPVRSHGRAMLNGRDMGTKWRITWPPTVAPFRLIRKLRNLRSFNGKQSFRNHHRMIIKADPIPQEPMRCITVDSPNSMYLAGRTMIPTHNTRLVCEEAAWQGAFAPPSKNEADALRIGIIAPTFSDLRKISFEGNSGLLSIIPEALMWKKSRKLAYNRNNQELRLWNGTIFSGFSAEEPDRLRGSQFHIVVAEEVASYREEEAMDQIEFCLRLGKNPRLIIATTPRPTKLIKRLVKDGEENPTAVRIIRGSTFENVALGKRFFDRIKARYGNTRLGKQELYAAVLGDTPGALWTDAMIEATRLVGRFDPQHERTVPPELPDFVRVVVAIDPMTGEPDKEERPGTGSETGIIVAAKGVDGRAYILEDLSCASRPSEWATIALQAYGRRKADAVIAETNQGGLMVENTIRTISRNEAKGIPDGAYVNYRGVHASRGKVTRAEPISSLYERGLVSHVGTFGTLESQMTTYVPGSKSPDRLDALVWALTDLMVDDIAVPTHVDEAVGESSWSFMHNDGGVDDYYHE